jgi:hypothetical protein
MIRTRGFAGYRHQGIGTVVCERVASPLQLMQSKWRDLQVGERIGSGNPGFDGFQAGPELVSAGGKGLGYDYGLIQYMEGDDVGVASLGAPTSLSQCGCRANRCREGLLAPHCSGVFPRAERH